MTKFLDALSDIGTPLDISARMDFTNARGEVMCDTEGKPAWIEFLGAEAEPVRRFRRQVERESIVDARQEQRKGLRKLSQLEADRELDKLNQTALEGLAHRVKAWYLVQSNGEPLDFPCNVENVKALFDAPQFRYLKSAAIVFLQDEENFFPKSASSSSSSDEPSSGSHSAATRKPART